MQYTCEYLKVTQWLEFIKILGFQSLKIQISCLDNLQRIEDLDLINSPRILNLKIPEFEITSKLIEF